MKIISDVDRGAWLAGLMHGWAQVGSVAGHGFEAYVRLLHPRPWKRGDEEDWSRRRWADIATRRGRVMHPLVQWERLLEVDESRHSSDVGWLDPLVLAELAPLLAAATTTPDDAVAAFWEGGSGQKLRTPAVLELPDPARVLAQTSLTEVGDPDWGHTMRLGWRNGLRTPSLQLLWPEDHAWVLATEIDWDSTIVAGGRALADAILADGRFEAFEVRHDFDLSSRGDTVNRP
ncbi:hypothetical protein [Frigoribacterium salinisoli]